MTPMSLTKKVGENRVGLKVTQSQKAPRINPQIEMGQSAREKRVGLKVIQSEKAPRIYPQIEMGHALTMGI